MKKPLLIILSALLIAALLGAALSSCRKSDATREEKVERFISENPSLKQAQTVFIGDSITEHYPIERYFRALDTECYNRGISGDTTDWLLSRLQVSLFDLAPSRVVLMIGTNDINLGRSAEEIGERYALLLDTISKQLPDAEVFCVSIIPQNEKYSEDASANNLRIMKANEIIKSLSGTHGYTYVDLYSELTDDDGLLSSELSTDGLHLNRRGYRVWTPIMKELLK